MSETEIAAWFRRTGEEAAEAFARRWDARKPGAAVDNADILFQMYQAAQLERQLELHERQVALEARFVAALEAIARAMQREGAR